MKKILFFTLITLLCVAKINAQCAVATQSLSENFTAVPPCWYPIGTAISGGQFVLNPTTPGTSKTMILPKTINAKGILEFDVKNTTNGNPTVTLLIGAVSSQTSTAMSSFQLIKSHAVPMAQSGGYIVFAHHVVDLSNYVGTNQFIALSVNYGTLNPTLYLDNVTYNSACISTSVTAIVQNYTVQLNSNGIANVLASNINNGSSSDCGTPSLSLSKTFFDCSNIGINTVTLTAIDNNSNTAVANASVTVLPAINNEIITSAQNIICTGNSSTITTGSSLNGIKYYLRNDADNNVIAGPIIGTGNALSFNTGSLTANTTFNVYAETQGGGNYALDFDGTNDVINTNITTSTTNSLTIEAWIYPRAATYKRIISNYFNNAAQSGEIILDTYNATNNGRGLRLVVEGAGNTLHQLSSANVLTLNTWNHVAGTFSNGVTKLYVNGIAVATSTAPFTSIPSCNNTISIGEDPTIGSSEYFNGKMDDIRIWNTARTQSEIAGNMNNCLVGNESGLRNYFKLNENTGNMTSDLITGAIGTMSGMTPPTAWVVGNVDCGAASCDLEMTQTVTVNVNSLPTINATTNNTLICAGETTSLTASGASTYTWNPGGDGTSISVSPTVTTTYSVIGTDANGCKNNSVITQSVSLCTGINQLTNTINEVSIFPNPSSINLTVKTDTEIQAIFIYNSLGALVQTEKTNTFSVEQLPTGLYILKVKTEKRTSTVRFIKE